MFKIEDIMTKKVITVNKDTPIQEAIRIIVEHNITGLPVVNTRCSWWVLSLKKTYCSYCIM